MGPCPNHPALRHKQTGTGCDVQCFRMVASLSSLSLPSSSPLLRAFFVPHGCWAPEPSTPSWSPPRNPRPQRRAFVETTLGISVPSWVPSQVVCSRPRCCQPESFRIRPGRLRRVTDARRLRGKASVANQWAGAWPNRWVKRPPKPPRGLRCAGKQTGRGSAGRGEIEI